MDKDGEILANGRIKYIKMDTQKIQEGVEVHEEMPYLVEDGRTEIEGLHSLTICSHYAIVKGDNNLWKASM